MGQKIDNALGLYMDGIRDGNVREAIEKYTGDRYTQHSTGVADGREGFIAFFEPFLARTPERDIRVLRTIEDGQYAFCQVSQNLNGGASRWVTTDLFDTDSNHKIIEHWDVIQEWSEERQIDGSTERTDFHLTDENKEVVRRFVEGALIAGQDGVADELVAEALLQHENGVADGRSAWMEALRGGDQPTHYREIFKLIGEGNLVVTYSKVDRGSAPFAVFDVFRLDGGKIVERWCNAEPVPEDTGNSGKF